MVAMPKGCRKLCHCTNTWTFFVGHLCSCEHYFRRI